MKKKCKDSWNRQEVIKLLNAICRSVSYPETYYEPCNSGEVNDEEFQEDIDKWIERNL